MGAVLLRRAWPPLGLPGLAQWSRDSARVLFHSLIFGSMIVAFRSAKAALLSRSERRQYTATRLFNRDKALVRLVAMVPASLQRVSATGWRLRDAAGTTTPIAKPCRIG